MKNVLLLTPLLLVGCAAGINHNIATVNGRTYLVETKVDNLFTLYQFSRKSRFIPIDGQALEQKEIQKEVDKQIEEASKICKKHSRMKNQQISERVQYDSQKYYDCMMKELK